MGWDEMKQWKQKVKFIKGLYQAGQWTFPGAMVNSVYKSGEYAAKLILRNELK